MAERSESALRRLAAELRAEVLHIDRTVAELGPISKGISNERFMRQRRCSTRSTLESRRHFAALPLSSAGSQRVRVGTERFWRTWL